MVDTVQLVLLLVIVGLTVLLVVLGIQVFYILKDIRKTLEKANHVLDNAGSITDNVTGPINTIATLATGLKTGSVLTVAKFVQKLLSKDEDDERKHG